MINIKQPGKEKRKRIVVIYRCPDCNRKDSRYRTKTNDYLCNTCECVWEDIPDTTPKKWIEV